MPLPRLTGALRAFAAVSAEAGLPSRKEGDLKAKRRHQSRRKAEEGLVWSELAATVKKHSKLDTNEVVSKLRDLIAVTKDIVGSESSSDIVEAGASFLFELFKDEEHVTTACSKKIRSYFGPFPASAATKAHTITNTLAYSLPDDVLHKLTSERGKEEKSAREFGAGIKFNAEVKDDDEGDLFWLESDSEEEIRMDFSMKWEGNVTEKVTASQPGAAPPGGLDPGWLKRQVETYYSGDTGLGMSVPDLCSTIFDVLSTSRPDTELQNELFELLGFDRFELIEKLLQNRQKLITAAFDSATEFMLNQKNPPQSRRVVEDSSRPNYGCQITIQTEEEKALQKRFRKEEKKYSKKREGEFQAEEQLRTFGFDPQALRAQREAQLYAASMAPLVSMTGSARQRDEPKYPYVFDSYAEAKKSSAFVGSAKMILPVGFEREDNKQYEEVNIPPTDPGTTHVGRKLVPISSLDDVGQLGFQGMKNLNRIQSVVFETAYKSNENLLICAPTGAGKTNIAMLTVLHQLKQHISQGVIKKDEFKIVYVAPMKALAAEMVRNFGKRLEPLGILVKELTGDMQLTKAEIMKTQMLVTTPEKWDVVTRKSTGDVALTQIVKLLILDEVHLLHDDRGAVIESLVARTIRQVESSQSMIRIVGLSATLPNYLDVARFLNVNPYSGLFFFDGRFRPVPLAQTFIGVKATNRMQQIHDTNEVCYDKVVEQVRKGYQVMIFVHARNETVRTAQTMCEMAKNCGDITLFQPESSPQYGEAEKQMMRSRNKQMKELFPDGFGIHHAGMLRQDRNLVEKHFAAGLIKCLVCTATLAWGVNLPAHAVIIKGTQIYDAKKGSFIDLGILDVLQIFGRAGRPQYDTFGHGTIITTHDKLSMYLSLLTRQNPIESQFIGSLTDNLNAEISLGTVTNMEEAVKWLSYTYLFVRMRINPLAYGVNYSAVEDDPMLEVHRMELIRNAARALDKARMIRYDERTGYMNATDLGRTASHFYIKYDTVEVFNEMFKSVMTEDKVLEMVSKSQEFDQIKVREEELGELDEHMDEICVLPVAGGSENTYGKVNILLQTYIARKAMDSFSLVSDQAYVAQNAARIIRALFEMSLKKGWPIMANRTLAISKIVEKRMWGFEHPLRQFPMLGHDVLDKLERRKLSLEKLREMEPTEIGHMIHHVRMGSKVKQCVGQIPSLILEASIQPITRQVLSVRLKVTPDFKWNDKVHGSAAEPFWIWVEDPENNHIYYSEYFMMHKKHVVAREVQNQVFHIPIFEPLPSQYYVKAVSDRWIGSETVEPISFQHLILPDQHAPHTELLNLSPLPISALNDHRLEALYKFTHFNPVQTQIFHPLYHTDCNVLLGAPTGSGKTLAAEMAIFRVFREYPNEKCVYIAPLKALVRERMEDWSVRIEKKLGKKVVELTGDVAPDMRAVARADLIVTTPEKWDGISRSWQTRNYVKAVSLLVIDEIHLLGEDRGPVLEVIVSRTNFISSHMERKVRVVGLSTALANARDLACWLNIGQMGLFNFRASVRPVPLEVHISGFPGKHYCPRMATMNKPCYQAIRTHSPAQPVLIFVSSRRQTRLTALDLIAFLAAEDDPKQWLHMREMEMENIITGIRDTNLKLTLAFGIGLHHAGLHERDRKTVEELFVNQKIQVLIATSTLAWGVNFPAHLVIVKGTEYFDGKTKRYVDFPITDVLQMMGRAGRPQFDDQGKAVILVHDVKKDFYKRFLYEPFPVESSLLDVLPEHLNAEIVAGTISSKEDALFYLTWTYFYWRLTQNPSYYNLESTDHDTVNKYLSRLVAKAVFDLETGYCVDVGDDNSLTATTLGRIASYYYLNHKTMRLFQDELAPESTIENLIETLSNAHEYAELPVRHNEDQLNSDLAKKLPLAVNQYTLDSSHTKTHLLLQAHFCQEQLPSSDYFTDTKSVLDQAIRILQSMLDVCADQGWLVTSLRVITLIQMVLQGRWNTDSSLLCLPHIQSFHVHALRNVSRRQEGQGARRKGGVRGPVETLPELAEAVDGRREVLQAALGQESQLSNQQLDQIISVLNQLPMVEVSLSVKGWWDSTRGGEGERPVVNIPPGVRRTDEQWIQVHADQEYVLKVDLGRINKYRMKDSRAYVPRYGKPKDEGWFLVLGEVDTREVLALKRVGYLRGRTSVSVAFYAPETPGRVIYTLYLMSDCYLGLDQQYDLHLEVIPASIEAQVNAELDFDDLVDDLSD